MTDDTTFDAGRLSRRQLLAAAAVVPVAAALPTVGVVPARATTVAATSGVPPLRRIGESVVASNAAFSPTVNNWSFQLDAITTYAGWQYAAFYVDTGDTTTDGSGAVVDVRYVAVGRRQLPDGPWTLLVLDDYQQTDDDQGPGDFHKAISLGICPLDGTLHLAFDMHGDPLAYRRSVPGLVADPESFAWAIEDFGPVVNRLGADEITTSTYPQFVTTPRGRLLYVHRDTSARSGAQVFHTYDGAGGWSRVDTGPFTGDFASYPRGTVIASPAYTEQLNDNVSAYLNGLTYDRNGRLHITWCWRRLPRYRPDPSGMTDVGNFGLMYAYSDDDGLTWRNDEDEVLTLPINARSTEVEAWSIPPGVGLLNTEGQTVDAEGNVHVVMRDRSNFWHYRRRAYNGYWERHDTEIPVSQLGPRTKIATDPYGNAYVVGGNLRIWVGFRRWGFQDFWLVSDPVDSGKHSGSPLYDRVRLADGVLSVLYQGEKHTPDRRSTMYVVEYELVD